MNIHSVVNCYFTKYLKKIILTLERNVRKEESSLSLQMLGNCNDEGSIYVEQKRIDVFDTNSSQLAVSVARAVQHVC